MDRLAIELSYNPAGEPVNISHIFLGVSTKDRLAGIN